MQSDYSRENFVDMDKILPSLVDYYVAFYGEQYREVIEEKLSEVVYMFVCSSNSPYDRVDFYKKNVIPPFLFKEMLNEETNKLIAPLINEHYEGERKAILKTINAASSQFASEGEVHACLTKEGKVRNFVFINVNSSLTDHTFVHELVHVIETEVDYLGQDKAVVTCGIAAIKDYENGAMYAQMTRDELINRIYQCYLNELFTEYKAMQVYDKMKEDGFEIVNDKKPNMVYRNTFFVTEPIIKMLLPYENDVIFKRKKERFIKLFGGEQAYAEFNRNLYSLSNKNFEPVKRELNALGVDIENPQDIINKMDQINAVNYEDEYITLLQYFLDMARQIEKNIASESNL